MLGARGGEKIPTVVSTGPKFPRPGRCFNCGGKGHWKRECTEEPQAQDKMSTIYNFFSFDKSFDCSAVDAQVNVLLQNKSSEKYVIQPDDSSKNVHSSMSKVSTLSPVGRLKAHKSRWSEIRASEYVLGIIENGYKLPFKTEPELAVLQNNKSARENGSFVSDEIAKLVDKGCVSQVISAPYVVNPLTVAENKTGKQRLVLDCRHLK